MKDIQMSHLALAKSFLVLLTIFLIHPTLIFAADAEHYSEETLISLDFDNKSLNQVLKEISWITGYSFVINKEYAEIKVTGTLKNVPLHQGLKEIIGKRSHTITYEPNKTVSLNIYKSSPPAPHIQNLMAVSTPATFTITPQPYNEVSAPSSAPSFEQNVSDLEMVQDDEIENQDELDTEYDQEYDDSEYAEEFDANYDDEGEVYKEYNDQYQRVKAMLKEERDGNTEDFDPYDDAIGTERSNDYQELDDYQEQY